MSLQPDERVTPQAYNEVLQAKQPHLLLDVRPMDQQAIVKLNHSYSLPLDTIVNGSGVDQVQQLLQDKPDSVQGTKQVFVMCRRGNASQSAVRELKNRLKQEVASGKVQIKDIIGGIERWSKEIDSTVPLY